MKEGRKNAGSHPAGRQDVRGTVSNGHDRADWMGWHNGRDQRSINHRHVLGAAQDQSPRIDAAWAIAEWGSTAEVIDGQLAEIHAVDPGFLVAVAATTLVRIRIYIRLRR